MYCDKAESAKVARRKYITDRSTTPNRVCSQKQNKGHPHSGGPALRPSFPFIIRIGAPTTSYWGDWMLFNLFPIFLIHSVLFLIIWVAYFEKVTFEIFWSFALLPPYCSLGPLCSRHTGKGNSRRLFYENCSDPSV